jgi:hypothetical protein
MTFDNLRFFLLAMLLLMSPFAYASACSRSSLSNMVRLGVGRVQMRRIPFRSPTAAMFGSLAILSTDVTGLWLAMNRAWFTIVSAYQHVMPMDIGTCNTYSSVIVMVGLLVISHHETPKTGIGLWTASPHTAICSSLSYAFANPTHLNRMG